MAGQSIATNLREVQAAILAACTRFGRHEGDVKLVAVSKTKSILEISEAKKAGQRIFAENYVQELLEKIKVHPELEWHFIGSLQSNKVKDIVGRVSLIHSVDRLKVASEINKEALKKSIVQDILLQIHIGDEASKHGFSEEEITREFASIAEMKGLRLRGVMSMPPLSIDENISRGYFRTLYEIHNMLKKTLAPDAAKSFTFLSMGTTSDFSAAIAEGATHVRIGTAIFGERER
jgi:pyridoxal phosphate enzyme (YggS family)